MKKWDGESGGLYRMERVFKLMEKPKIEVVARLVGQGDGVNVELLSEERTKRWCGSEWCGEHG